MKIGCIVLVSTKQVSAFVVCIKSWFWISAYPYPKFEAY